MTRIIIYKDWLVEFRSVVEMIEKIPSGGYLYKGVELLEEIKHALPCTPEEAVETLSLVDRFDFVNKVINKAIKKTTIMDDFPERMRGYAKEHGVEVSESLTGKSLLEAIITEAYRVMSLKKN